MSPVRANAQRGGGRASVTDASTAAAGPAIPADVLKGLQVRSIGPGLVTGRISDVKIDPNNPSLWYIVTAFGGVWKTVNRGASFTPIFDDQSTHNFCCMEIDPKNSNVLWLGSGENHSQRSAHFGDGLYKSIDAGKTWKRVGLALSEHIGKIIIDPRNSDVVYVASQGPLFSAGGERGLYKTSDGGTTWTRSLFISDNTGITDIVLDPKNADVLYAATYPRRRHVGQAIGGSPEGGIHKSMDAGKTWKKLGTGLPTGDVGRAALAIEGRTSPTQVTAFFEASAGQSGLYRSTDDGATWTRPDGVSVREIDAITGRLATSACTMNVVTEFFVAGTEPTLTCTDNVPNAMLLRTDSTLRAANSRDTVRPPPVERR